MAEGNPINPEVGENRQLPGLPVSDSASAIVSEDYFESSQALSIESLRAENALLRFSLAFMPVGFCMFDKHDRLQLCNEKYLEIWELPKHLGQRGTHFETILSASKGKELEVSGAKPLGTSGENRREFVTKSGKRIEVHIHLLPDGVVVALHEDVTARRKDEAQIVYLARHDTLTTLDNRASLYDSLREILAQDNVQEVALLYLDLDNFKQINDNLGHSIGDLLLQEVAQRLRTCVRSSDLVARLGGDEFAVVMINTPQPESARSLSHRIIESLAEPFELAGRQIHISASIGISLSPQDGRYSEELFKKADMALQHAKAHDKGTHLFFEPDMESRARARRTLEADLALAIQKNEFELFYQPQVNLETMRLSGAEALLRWNHPERGMVPPDQFIPLAEETGLIIQIGQWVLQQACREAMNWPDNISVAVNVSGVQIQHPGLFECIDEALTSSKLPANRLEIEITETVVMENSHVSIGLLERIKNRGIQIAIDDFGTGYSSLQYLRSFPFDKIKIDRSFVFNIESDPDALSIVRAVTTLANNLGISTIAEGVETNAQLELIRQEGCKAVQGYLFGKPCRASEILPMMISSAQPFNPGKSASS